MYKSEAEARQALVKCALKYLGVKEGSSMHHKIIDSYNSIKPRPRDYKVKYTDAWCATFVTFVFDSLCMSGLIERECGCQEMINKCKKRNLVDFTKKSDSQVVGNIVFYDWENDNHADHVGIIQKISGSQLYVIEGNHNDAVSMRTIPCNSNLITAYVKPHYEIFVKEGYDYENLGWNKDATGWWYAYGHNKGEYYSNTLITIDKKRYAFNDKGYLCDMSMSTFNKDGSLNKIGGVMLAL